jgi:predicted DNA-binding transcriptional regulator AlpA
VLTLYVPALVAVATCRRKASHYGDISAGMMTRLVAIGPRSVVWPQHEIEAINATSI